MTPGDAPPGEAKIGRTTVETLYRGASIIFIAMLLGAAFQFLARMIIARTVGIEDFGVVAVALAVFMLLASMAPMGMHVAVARNVAHYKATENGQGIRDAVQQGYTTVVVAATALAVVLWATAADIAELTSGGGLLTDLLRMVALAIPFQAASILSAGVLRGMGMMTHRATVDQLALYGLQLGAAAIALLVGASSRALFGSLMAVSIAVALLGLWLVLRILPKRGPAPSENGLWRIAGPAFMTQGLGQLRARADLFIAAALLPSAAIGSYAAAIPVARLLQNAQNASNTVLLPMAAALHATSSDSRHLYRTAASGTFLLTTPVAWSLAWKSQDILVVLFGPDYGTAGTALQILALATWLSVVAGPFGEMLVAQGYAKWTMLYALLALVVNVTLAFVLVPRHGIAGAAAAAGASLVVASLVGAATLWIVTRAHPFTRRHSIALGILAVWAAVSIGLDLFLQNRVAGPFLAVGTFLLGSYLSFWLSGTFTQEEKQALRRLVKPWTRASSDNRHR